MTGGCHVHVSPAARALAHRHLLLASLAGAALLVSASTSQAGGQCYRQVTQPALYETRTEQVLLRPATSVARVAPAVYGQVAEKVLVQPARQVARTIPGTWATVNERVMIEPARVVSRTIRPSTAR